jgi:hypothetical protein
LTGGTWRRGRWCSGCWQRWSGSRAISRLERPAPFCQPPQNESAPWIVHEKWTCSRLGAWPTTPGSLSSSRSVINAWLALVFGSPGTPPRAKTWQEAMARVLERWDRVSRMDDPEGYLYKTALNIHRNMLKRIAIAARLEAKHDTSADPDFTDRRLDLLRAIRSLPRTQRRPHPSPSRLARGEISGKREPRRSETASGALCLPAGSSRVGGGI